MLVGHYDTNEVLKGNNCLNDLGRQNGLEIRDMHLDGIPSHRNEIYYYLGLVILMQENFHIIYLFAINDFFYYIIIIIFFNRLDKPQIY